MKHFENHFTISIIIIIAMINTIIYTIIIWSKKNANASLIDDDNRLAMKVNKIHPHNLNAILKENIYIFGWLKIRNKRWREREKNLSSSLFAVFFTEFIRMIRKFIFFPRNLKRKKNIIFIRKKKNLDCIDRNHKILQFFQSSWINQKNTHKVWK